MSRKHPGADEYLKIGDFADNLTGTKADKERWVIDNAGRIGTFLILALPPGDTARLNNWPSKFEVNAQQKSRIQDMPCCLAGRPVVSDRLRKLIEQLSPGAAQYLPVRIMWRGEPIGGRYWVANWLRAVDCVDWARSTPRIKSIPPVEPAFLEKMEIDPRKIPASAQVFVVKHVPTTVLCTRKFRKALDDAGMVGVQYLDYE